MATTSSAYDPKRITKLSTLLGVVYWKTTVQELSQEDSLRLAMQEVNPEDVAMLILQAGNYIDPFTCISAYGIGSIRYPDTWKEYLLDVLESIVKAILDSEERQGRL